MKLPEPLKGHLATILVTAIAGLIVFFATKIYHDISAPLLAHVVPAISNATLLSACLLLLLLVILFAAWVIYLHRIHKQPTPSQLWEKFHDRFGDFDAELGLWRHKSKKGYFCPNCKVKGIESQMRETATHISCLVKDCLYWVQKPQPELALANTSLEGQQTKPSLRPGIEIVPPPKD